MTSTILNPITAGFQPLTERGGFLARLVRAVATGLEMRIGAVSRRAFIAQLEAKSDAELSALGLRRDQIARHVHRDLFYA